MLAVCQNFSRFLDVVVGLVLSAGDDPEELGEFETNDVR